MPILLHKPPFYKPSGPPPAYLIYGPLYKLPHKSWRIFEELYSTH